MKPLLLLSFLLILVIALPAQTVPEFGQITIPDREITECAFDKEAEAVILFDQASSNYDDQHHLITEHHTRLKILKQKGIERGDISIYYYHENDFEFISGIEAAVYTPDANGNLQTIPLKKSAIFRQKVSDYVSVVKFALPDVKVGSILEYKYTSTMKSYSGLEDWNFQWDIPILYSSYSLVILPNMEFTYQVHKSPDLPIDVDSDNGSGKIVFEMKNIAALRDEPFMDAPRDYKQRVEFQLSAYGSPFGDRRKFMTTWEELTRELSIHSQFGVQLNKNVSAAAGLISAAKAKGSPFATMTAIYDHLQQAIGQNGYKTRFAQVGIRETWDKKKGSSGDINLLLVNLLNEAGLDAYPLLVSERSHGKVRADYPFLDQFNNVMAFVVIGDNTYVLDAAGPYTPPDLIPFSVVNTTAFVVNRKKGGIRVLEEKKRMNQQRILIRATVENDGSMHGNGLIKSYDYGRLGRLTQLAEGKETYRKEYISRFHPSMVIDSIDIRNEDNDSLPLDQQVYFHLPANSSGEYKLINLNLFSGFEESPFISDIRFTNVDYGCPQSVELISSVSIPAGLTPDAIPKNSRLIMPDTSISFSRFYQHQGNTLSILFRIEVSRTVFTADDYPLLKEFYKKMIAMLNEPFILKNQ